MDDELDLDEILLRGVQANRMAWDHAKRGVVPMLQNFKLRVGEAGLSVNRKGCIASHESISQGGRFVCFLAITMRRLVDLGLSAKIKEHDPTGADIVGLPAADDSDAAADWAFALADAFVWDLPPNSELIEKIGTRFYSNNPTLSPP